jgi:hypothetical protein
MLDVITNFTGGVAGDVLNFHALSASMKSAIFVGNVADYSLVAGALSLTTTNAVFDTADHTLYIDINHDGALTTADMAIKLTGVTTLDASNVVLA